MLPRETCSTCDLFPEWPITPPLYREEQRLSIGFLFEKVLIRAGYKGRETGAEDSGKISAPL
jgi:hypothetical protein